MSMSKVTHTTMTPQHVKAARALLDWNAQDLANQCEAGVSTVRVFESGKTIRETSRQAIYDALVEAGITFQNGGQPGVRFVGRNKHEGKMNVE